MQEEGDNCSEGQSIMNGGLDDDFEGGCGSYIEC